MANDLVTRLLLNSTNFESNLGKSAMEVQNFQRTVGRVSKGVGTAFNTMTSVVGKMIPALGAVTGALGAFNKIIDSSQTLTDSWGRTTEATTTVIDGLFQSISNGSFLDFITGLKDVIENAREAYNAIDALSTLNAFRDKQTSEFAKRRAQIRADLKKGLIDQAEAQNRLNKLEKEEQDYLSHTASTNRNAFYAKLTEYTKSKAGSGWVTKYFYEGGQDDAKKEANRLQGIIDGAKFRQAKTQGNWNLMTQMLGMPYNEAKQKIQALTNFSELHDDKIGELSRLWGDANRAEQTYFDNLSRDSRIVGSGGTTKTPKASTPTPSTSIIPMGEVGGLDLVSIDPNRLGYYEKRVASLKEQLKDPTLTSTKYVEIQVKLDKAQEDLEKFKTGTLGQFDIPNLAETIEPIKTELEDVNEEWVSMASTIDLCGRSIQAMGQVFSAMGDDNVQIFASILQSVVPLISAIEALTMAEATENAVRSSKHWIELIAAVGSVTALIMSIQSKNKYADGGIVGGNSFVGDRIVAHVNSGEMILNRRQQANLFNMIANGRTEQPQSGGNVTFRIQGKELVGVLNNYNNKRGKLV